MEVGGHSSRVYSFWGDPIATVTGVFQTSDTRRHRTEDRPFLATRHDDPRGRVDSSIFSASFCVVDVFRFAFAFAFGPGEVQSLQHLISWETPMHSSSLSLSLSYTETSTFFLSHRLYNSEDIYIRFICIAFHHDSHGQLPNACSPDPRVAHPGAPGGSRVASAEGSRWRCLKS